MALQPQLQEIAQNRYGASETAIVTATQWAQPVNAKDSRHTICSYVRQHWYPNQQQQKHHAHKQEYVHVPREMFRDTTQILATIRKAITHAVNFYGQWNDARPYTAWTTPTPEEEREQRNTIEAQLDRPTARSYPEIPTPPEPPHQQIQERSRPDETWTQGRCQYCHLEYRKDGCGHTHTAMQEPHLATECECGEPLENVQWSAYQGQLPPVYTESDIAGAIQMYPSTNGALPEQPSAAGFDESQYYLDDQVERERRYIYEIEAPAQSAVESTYGKVQLTHTGSHGQRLGADDGTQ